MNLDKLDKQLGVVKQFFTILLYVVVIVLVIVLSPQIIDFYKNAHLSESSILGHKWTTEELNETKEVFETAINLNDNKESAVDTEADSATLKYSQKIEMINTQLQQKAPSKKVETENWIFAGAFDVNNNRWLSRYINIEGKINRKHIYRPLSNLNIRNRPPEIVNGVWEKGRIVGALDQDNYIEIKEIETIPGIDSSEFYWLKVHVLNK
jgi:hypothetical protein